MIIVIFIVSVLITVVIDCNIDCIEIIDNCYESRPSNC